MVTITIKDVGTDRYTIEADCCVLGRRYDNVAEQVKVILPEFEINNGSMCTMIVAHGDTIIDNLGVGQSGDTVDITSNLSQYDTIKIGFAFIKNGKQEYIKNSEFKQFVFLPALKPYGFTPIEPDRKLQLEQLISFGFVRVEMVDRKLNFYNVDDSLVATADFTEYLKQEDIVDDLDTQEASRVLSANQGYVLNEKIKDLDSKKLNDFVVNDESSVENNVAKLKVALEQDKGNNLQYHLKVNDKNAGTINIPKDQFLKSVNYNEDTNILTFIWETTQGEKTTTIDMTDLVDIYTAGDGLELSGGKFSVKLDAATNGALSVSADGLKLDLTEVDDRLTDIESNITNIEAKDVEQDLLLTAMEEANKDRDIKINALEKKSSEHEQDLADAETRIGTAESDITAIKQKNTEQDTAISVAQSTADSKYSKPDTGIPTTDLAIDVQESLGKADTAVQPEVLTDYIPKTDIRQVSGVGDAGYADTAERQKVISVEALSYWNGAYMDETSNLRYFKNGEIAGKSDIPRPLWIADSVTLDDAGIEADYTIAKKNIQPLVATGYTIQASDKIMFSTEKATYLGIVKSTTDTDVVATPKFDMATVGYAEKQGQGVTDTIRYTDQTLTAEQQAQARKNIGAGTSSFDGNYSSLNGTPTIGNATLTIQKEGTSVGTFTANATADKAINIVESDPTVPSHVKSITESNISTWNSGAADNVKYTTQTLTDPQKTQARTNIGAGTSNFDGQYSSLSGTPTLGSLASKNTITSAEITDGTITKADLATAVQTSLGKADTAVQPSALSGYIPTSQRGTPSGVATLDTDGRVPISQLPSYVDDVQEFDKRASFPETGEEGKIYVAKDTNLTYRWSGTDYTEISPSLALGETTSTAYAGNKGKANADAISALQTRATAIETKNDSQDTAISAAQSTANSAKTTASTAVQTVTASNGITASKSGTGVTITGTNASTTANGMMSKDDKSKLDAFGAASTYATKEDLSNVKIGYATETKIGGVNAWIDGDRIVNINNTVVQPQPIIASKKLSELSIGTKVKDPNSTFYNVPIVWTVADQNHTGYPKNSTTLIPEKIITVRCFDAQEPNSIERFRQQSGNNKYSVSNIDQWLNSEAGAGAWYSARHDNDQPPDESHVWKGYNPYDQDSGFMTNLSATFKKNLLTTTLKVCLDSVDGGNYEFIERQIFLPSATEVGLVNSYNIEEGERLALFTDDESRAAYPTAEAVSNSDWSGTRFTPEQSWYYWTRSPAYVSSATSHTIRDGGMLSKTEDYFGYRGVRPLCNLSGDVLVSAEPDENGIYTILESNTLNAIKFNGQTIDIPSIADRTYWDSKADQSALNELVDEVSGVKAIADNKYEKPTDGIPATDLASAIQTSLDKADASASNDDLQKVIDNETLIVRAGGGFAAGREASLKGSFTDTMSEVAGGAIGQWAKAGNGFAGGAGSETYLGGAIGSGSFSTQGGAIGSRAIAGYGFSGGVFASVKNTGSLSSPKYIDAIQLGTGTNSIEKSLQVYDDNIYNAETHTLTVPNIATQTIIAGTTHTNQTDTVTEYWVSSDNNTWYRIWASGWKQFGTKIAQPTIEPNDSVESSVTYPDNITISNICSAKINTIVDGAYSSYGHAFIRKVGTTPNSISYGVRNFETATPINENFVTVNIEVEGY